MNEKSWNMRYLVCCVVILSGLVSGVVYAEETTQPTAELETCLEPGMMLVPDGNKASSEDMLQAQQDVNSSITTTKAYLTCLLANEKAIGDALTYEQKKTSIIRYNLAVTRMERLVDSYNQQLRAYQQVNNE